MSRHSRNQRTAAALVAALLIADVALAQSAGPDVLATSTNGRVGKRQAADGSAIDAKPLGRVNTRLQNRVASRIQTRIDSNSLTRSGATAYSEAARQTASPLNGAVRGSR